MSWTGPIENVEFSATSSGTTLTFSPAATIPVGTLIVVAWAGNGNVSASTAADNSSQSGTANSYTLLGGVVIASLAGSNVYCVATRSILTSDVITITLTGACTRRNGRLITFTGVKQTAPLDGALNVSPTATNPIVIGPTSTLTTTAQLSLGFSFWTGGAVLSGITDGTSGYTLSAGAGSGGTTPRVEANFAYKTTAGTAAETDTHTFTSITNAGGQILTFKPANTYTTAAVSSTNRSTGIVSSLTTTTSKTLIAVSKTELLVSPDTYLGLNTILGDGNNSPTIAVPARTRTFQTAKYIFPLGSFYLDRSNSAGFANVTVSHGVTKTFAAIASGSSPATAIFSRVRTLIAVSNNTSMGIVTFARTRNFAAISNGSSIAITIIIRSRKLVAVSLNTTSGATCVLSRSRVSGYIGSGGSSGSAAFARTRTFAAISSGTSPTYSALARVRTFKAISGGTSTAITPLTSPTFIIAVSNSSSSARVTITRIRGLVSITSNASVCLVSLIRARNFVCVSAQISGAVATFARARKINFLSANTSSARASFAGVQIFSAISNSTSSAWVFVRKTKSITARSTGTSPSLAALKLSNATNAISNSTSSARTGIVRTRTFSTRPEIFTLGSYNLGEPNSIATFATGSTELITAISRSSSSATVALSRIRTFKTQSGLFTLGSLLGGPTSTATFAKFNFITAAISSGNSTFGVGLHVDHGLTCKSSNSSTGRAKLPPPIVLTCRSASSSSAIMTFSHTVVLNVISDNSGVSTNDLYVDDDTFVSDTTYLGIGKPSSNRAKLAVNHRFAAFSWASLYPGNYGPGPDVYPGMGSNSSGVAVGLVNVALLNAYSIGTSNSIATLKASARLNAISNNTSTAIATTRRVRAFRAYSGYAHWIGGFIIGSDPLGGQDQFTNSLSWASFGKTQTMAAVSATGSSSGVAYDRRIRGLHAFAGGVQFLVGNTIPGIVGPYNSSASASLSAVNVKNLFAVSNGSSSGTATLTRARIYAAITSDTSSASTGLVRTRYFAGVSQANSQASSTLIRVRAFAAISSNGSTGTVNVSPNRGITALTKNTSGATATFTRTRIFGASSSNTSPSNTIIFILGTHAYVSYDSSDSVATFARARVLVATSAGTSLVRTNLARARGSVALSNNSSSAINSISRNRGSAAKCSASSTGRVTLSMSIGNAARSTGSSSAQTIISRQRSAASFFDSNSTGTVSLDHSRIIIAVADGSSSGMVALGIGGTPIFAISRNTSSTAPIRLHMDLALPAYSDNSKSTGKAVIAHAAEFGVFSNSTSTGIVRIGNFSQYGTATIWDTNTFNIYISDTLVKDALIYDK